ncbi:MAG: class I SAM-dependent methyltransferase [Nitrososphaerales archaeon]|jgi:ubiquinone/menaquinone biosynthesis C-methylase UbiE
MSEIPAHERTQKSYDQIADDYLEHFRNELDGKPLDRALLGAVIEQAVGGLPVADLGCGPGHVAAWLADHGAQAVGIDLSPSMIETGRKAFPNVEFRLGDLLSLPARDGEFGAAVALYSIIHLRVDELRPAFEEMRRILAPGGVGLVTFHIGSELRHREEWWGQAVDLDFQFVEVPDVIASIEAVGFEVEAQLERRNYPDEVATRRGYILTKRPMP